MSDPHIDPADLAERRTKARRTALWLALIAAAIFVAFILSGVFGKAG